MNMKLGYIAKYDLKLNPHLTEPFVFKEASFTRRISSKGDRVYSKLLYPVDYEEIVENANFMRNNPKIILVQEPFLLDDELRKKATMWVEWANKADPSEYDLLAKLEVERRSVLTRRVAGKRLWCWRCMQGG